MTKIKFLKISAKDNYDFGFKLGKSLKEQIKYRIEKNKEVYWNKSKKKVLYGVLKKKARIFLPIIKKNFPRYVDEIKGIANGAEVDFDEILVMVCDEEIVDFGFTNHCTTVALKTKEGDFVLGHNEDWFPEFKKNGLFLVNGKIGKNKFLALGYVGSLAGSGGGLNSYGVAYSDTSFYFSRWEYKIPRSVHLRALLDVKTPREALDTLNCEGSIISNTVFVFNKYGIVDIEELWDKEEIFMPKDWIIHTNHPLIQKDRTCAHANEEKESVLRYKKALHIISSEKKPYNLNTIKKILSDHETDICGHLNKKKTDDSTITIASYLMNPKKKYLAVCEGNPCRGKYKKYFLK